MHYPSTANPVTRRTFLGLAIAASTVALTGCVRNGDSETDSSKKDKEGANGKKDSSNPFAPASSSKNAVDGLSIDGVDIEDATDAGGRTVRVIKVSYTFENVTESDTSAPVTDINAYQDGLKLDRTYQIQDKKASKQIEPGGKLSTFTAFTPESDTTPVNVKITAPGEKESRFEKTYCITNPGWQ